MSVTVTPTAQRNFQEQSVFIFHYHLSCYRHDLKYGNLS